MRKVNIDDCSFITEIAISNIDTHHSMLAVVTIFYRSFYFTNYTITIFIVASQRHACLLKLYLNLKAVIAYWLNESLPSRV